MIRRALIVLLILAFGITFFTSKTFAQENCSTLVLDNADGIDVFAGDFARVEETARELQNRAGAVVYVRAINTYKPESNLDQYFEEVALPACSSWQQTDGKAKNNLIVVIASFRENEREIGVYFGSEFIPALEDGWRNEVATGEILPRFLDGEFAQGYINGLERIGQLIEAYDNPPVSSGGVSGNGSSSSGSGDTTNINAGPIAIVVGIIAAIVALIVLLVLGSVFLSRRRKENEVRKAAQQKALNARNQVNNHINGARDILGEYRPLAEAVAAQVAKDSGESLLSGFDAAQKVVDAVLGSIDGQSVAFDPTDDKLTKAEYDNIAGSYEQILPDAQEALRLANTAKSNFAQLRDLIVQAPEILVRVREAITAAQTQIDQLKAAGFKVEVFQDDLDKAVNQTETAQQRIDGDKAGQAIRPLQGAEKIVESVKKLSVELVERKQTLEQAVVALDSRLVSAQSAILSARSVFDYIDDNYPPETYESIAGNGTESEKRVVKATAAVEKARGAVGMDSQDWETAESQVEVAQKALDQVDSLLHSITALRDNLDAAKVAAPNEISLAEVDLQKAADFIAANKADVAGQYKDDFSRARDLLSEAKQELRNKQPNFLVIVKNASQANSIADSILSEARSEVEKAERLRQAAVSALRDAKAAASRLEEYIQDHDSDIGSAAESDLRQAISLLTQAQGSQNPERILSLATEAEAEAENGYSKARSDFEEAENARERARARRRARSLDDDFGRWGSGGISIGSGLPNFGGGGSRSGGISIGGGSIGFGGGGGKHGGGSIKW